MMPGMMPVSGDGLIVYQDKVAERRRVDALTDAIDAEERLGIEELDGGGE
jgi:hypothetical protein